MWICIAHCREHVSNALPLPVYVGADLRYLVLSLTPAYSARPRIRVVYHEMDQFTPTVFAWYLFRIPTEGWLRLSRPGCLVLRWSGFTRPKRVTHPATSRRRVTALIEPVLPLSQTDSGEVTGHWR